MKTARKVALFLVVLILVSGTFFSGAYFGYKRADRTATLPVVWGDVVNRTKGQPKDVDFGLFWEVWTQINQNFVGEKDNKKRVYGAIAGAVAGLNDPYTVFLEPKTAKEFKDDLQGDFSGIGAELEMNSGLLTVVAPLSDTPAEKAGLKPRDIIIKIDDQDATELGFSEAVNKIRGQEGTKVKLTIVRKPDQEPRDFLIDRAVIHVKSVKWEQKIGKIKNGDQEVEYTKEDGIYVAKIRQFNSDTTSLLKEMAAEMEKNKAKKLILDLRSDPGGYLDTAQEVWGLLSRKEPLLIEVGKSNVKRRLNGTEEPLLEKYPLVVLIDEGSASSSEIVAGAVQDHGRGKLVGKKSYGKGSVQQLISLSDGSSLKITTAKWFTPNERGIDKQGIEPDIVVEYKDSDKEAGVDPQLNKALEVIKGM